MRRRDFFKWGVAAALAAGATSARPPAARADGPWSHLFRQWVPEIFAPLPDPPEHSPAIVIGSGFGGAVAALRLAAAGVRTTVLERGSQWPNDPWREIFTGDDLPDGRGFWHRTSFTGVTKVPSYFEDFGGVLDCTEYGTIDVWRAAAVGGGSVVFTGAMVQPSRGLFDGAFAGAVNYDELDRVYYPRVRQMLRLSTMPADVYGSAPFAHSREWDRQVRAAGYDPVPVESIFSWDIVRDELAGRSRPSATAARSNLGNSNGAKFDLNRNYLRAAQETGSAAVFPGHRVERIWQESGNRFGVAATLLSPTGAVLANRTLTCDRLFLAAGSIGTAELLVAARASGDLENLNEHVGEGWGTNGDVALARGGTGFGGGTGGVPCASRIFDDSGLPTTLENWYIPGLPLDVGAIASLGIVVDSTRGRFRHDPATGRVTLDWPRGGNDAARQAAAAVNDRIRERSGSMFDYRGTGFDANATFTAHPLGGAVLGRATDGFGRVVGHPGLYVTDGAAMPGTAAGANPSFTIAALAERNLEAVVRAGG